MKEEPTRCRSQDTTLNREGYIPASGGIRIAIPASDRSQSLALRLPATGIRYKVV